MAKTTSAAPALAWAIRESSSADIGGKEANLDVAPRNGRASNGSRCGTPAAGIVFPDAINAVQTGAFFDPAPQGGSKHAVPPPKDKHDFSGDLGKIDREGYVHIVGRGKDLVISGGYNIYPKEIEGEIDMIESVAESAVIGVPHPDFGEGVTAIVVRKPGTDLDEKAIVSALQNRLARYKQPKCIIFAEDLPRNTMGKVQKNVLRQQFADLYART